MRGSGHWRIQHYGYTRIYEQSEQLERMPQISAHALRDATRQPPGDPNRRSRRRRALLDWSAINQSRVAEESTMPFGMGVVEPVGLTLFVDDWARTVSKWSALLGADATVPISRTTDASAPALPRARS